MRCTLSYNLVAIVREATALTVVSNITIIIP